eukprot:766393-Hanusia_phi.AAC.18
MGMKQTALYDKTPGSVQREVNEIIIAKRRAPGGPSPAAGSASGGGGVRAPGQPSVPWKFGDGLKERHLVTVSANSLVHVSVTLSEPGSQTSPESHVAAMNQGELQSDQRALGQNSPLARSKGTHPRYPSGCRTEQTSSDGYAVKTFPSGNKYEGEWKDGKYHGKGKLIYADGRQYEGDWFQGVLVNHGKGSFLYANGDRYVGEYKVGRSCFGIESLMGRLRGANSTAKENFCGRTGTSQRAFVHWSVAEWEETRKGDGDEERLAKKSDIVHRANS